MPMELGDPARKELFGKDLNYYLNMLNETREQTLAEFESAMMTGWPVSTNPGARDRPTTTANGST